MNSSANSSLTNPNIGLTIFTITSLSIISTFGMCLSLLTVSVILASKSLRTPSFIFISASGIGSFSVSSFYFIRACDQLGSLLGLFTLHRSPLKCLLVSGNFGVFGISFHSQMATFLAIDRLLSVTVPHRYRLFSNRYIIGVISLSSLPSLVIYAFALGYLRADHWVTCFTWNVAVNPVYFETYVILNLFYCFSSSAAYCAMLLSFRYGHKFDPGASSTQDTFVKQQLAMIPTMKLMMVLYLLTGVLAELLILAGTKLGRIEITTVGSILKDASSMVEGSALLIKSKKFRTCFLTLIGYKSNNVVDIRASSNVR